MDHRPNNAKSEFVVQLRKGQPILNGVQSAHSPPQAVPPAQAGIKDQEPGRTGSGVVGSRVW